MEYIKWFEEIGMEDVELVGGKNASLGEMYRNLAPQGIRIPNGFAVTAEAYRAVLESNEAWEKLHALLDDLDVQDVAQLQERGAKCRQIILSCTLPETLVAQIREGYETLKDQYGQSLSLAVRSSATAEDSPEASFAGQNETFLNVGSFEALLEAYLACLASNFTDRSIHYKHIHGFEYLKVHLSVVVMKMVRSDIGSSGVMFSIDTESGFGDVVLINAAYGLGENIVQGSIEPDTLYVHKPTLKQGRHCVLRRHLGKKALKMIYDTRMRTVNVDTSPEERTRFAISDSDAVELAQYAVKIEAHYSHKAGRAMPMDMEWAKDGEDGKLYIVQARPETVQSRASATQLEYYKLKEHSAVLLQGQAVGKKIGGGKVRKVSDLSSLHTFQKGDVLVARTTSPDWEPVMKIASAVITEKGGRTCHAAIVSRELGIPAVVGAEGAFDLLEDAQEVTVSCAEGDTGFVYDGILPYETVNVDLSSLPARKTKVMMNLGNPDLAFSLASLPVDGIGLARMEFIISSSLKAHPMALIHPEKTDEATRKTLAELCHGYESYEAFFIQTLSEGIATIASSVYPKPCVVRMSDFKTNEYASLIGGKFFEGEEENPMIGFRGASRYAHPEYEEGFALECAAIKRVRETMGFENVIVMIPFCRRVEEAKKVIETMAKYGLVRGESGLQVYMMCEIPNNVILIDAFSEHFDGFSIGSNDLTQLTLGVDRDNEKVAFDYDERDEGVMKMIEMAVTGAKRNRRHSGICGQAPSDYPEVAEKLVRLGIDSMSLNPDSVIETIGLVGRIETEG